jgi:hypothetical protein
MSLGLSRVIKKFMVSVYILEILEHFLVSDTYFWLLGRNYLIYIVNLHRKYLKTDRLKIWYLVDSVFSWKFDWWTHLFPDPEL